MTPLRLSCLATVGALGLALITPLTARALTISGQVPEVSLSHFQCYEGYEARGSFRPITSFRPVKGVSVEDSFETAMIDLAASWPVKRFCNAANVTVPADVTVPANVNGDSALDDPNHLTGYVISARTPHFARRTKQVVVNELGTTTLTVLRPIFLMVPSAGSLIGIPTPLPTPATIDHFQCYAVRGARTRRSRVTVVDQFGTQTLDIKRPSRLCTAVDKNGEGRVDSAANLMCYVVIMSRGTVCYHGPKKPVYINNHLGPDTLKVTRPTELCFPSVLNPSP